MVEHYKGLYKNILARRTDNSSGVITLSKAIKQSSESDSLKYLKASLEEVSEEYTQISRREADRVKAALETGLIEYNIGVEFEYQGSVTNNTHIKAQSDIDLLALRTEFHSLKSPLVPSVPYMGNPTQDLVELRLASIQVLKRKFWAANVSDKNSMCIPVSGGSLLREVDVVPSNWYLTQEYYAYGDTAYKGIHVLDASVPERVINFPFLHNKKLEEKDVRAQRLAKPLIRCLKNIVADNPETKISSYNLNGLVYNLPDDCFMVWGPMMEIDLLNKFLDHAHRFEGSAYLRATCVVPNGTRHLFKDSHEDGIDLAAFTKLINNVQDLLNEIYEDIPAIRRYPNLRSLMAGR